MCKFSKAFHAVRDSVLFTFLLLLLQLITFVAKAQDVFTGLTSIGGPEGRGTAFTIKPTGSNFSIIKSFADWGRVPQGNLYKNSDGNFYGMTSTGGTYGAGTIFKMSQTGAITILHQLNFSPDGAYPNGELIKGNDGNLWGMTSSGGVNTYGTIFKITTAGVYTVIRAFNFNPDGATPYGHLILGSDGNFYGITERGGSAGGYGTIFKLTSSGTYTVLHALNGTTDGAYCYGSLTEGTDGNLYGITSLMGTNNYGTIFKCSKTGSFTVLRALTNSTDGGNSRGDLIQATDGNFYGVTAAGGANGYGTIFKITPLGTFIVIRAMQWTTDGANPTGLFQNTDGLLYGLAKNGGAHGVGTVFKMATSGGSFSLLHSFVTATEGDLPLGALVKNTDGTLYGLTSADGLNFGGSAFKISTTGTFTLLASFNGATVGNAPYESLLRGSDSAFYGTNSSGGAYNFGAIFKICAGNTSLLFSFSNNVNGGVPKGSLIEATNGVLYGMTTTGGSGGSGTIFKITKTGTYTVLHNLVNNTEGNSPMGSLVQATDGNLYGMTNTGGANGFGTIFKVTLSGTLSVLRALSVADGTNPRGDLIQGTDGNLYGVCYVGGSGLAGTIFKITTGGTYTVLHNLSASADGSNPAGSLVQAGNGNFYGTTSNGGSNGGGTIFKISSTGTYTVLKHLNPTTDGKSPQGKLLIGSDGNFYGMTSSGGTNNAGTIFKITPAGAYTVLRQLDLIADGGNPYGSLIIFPPNTLIANPQNVATKQDSSIKIKLTGSGGSPLTFNIVTKPKHGKLTGTTATRTYKPDSGYTGADVFTFNVTVGCVASSAAKVNITVNPATEFATETNNSEVITKADGIRIYPNPVSNRLTLALDKYFGQLHATISDARGFVLRQLELDVNGKSNVEMDVSRLPSGTYFLRIQTENSIQTLKFIKL